VKGVVRYQSHVVRHNLELIRMWRENRMIGKGGHMILLAAYLKGVVKDLSRGNFPLRSTPPVSTLPT
jgi:hypothetical protein